MRTSISDFKNLMEEILPKLSPDDQVRVREVFDKYHSMLVTAQKLLTRMKMRVQRAETQKDMFHAIDREIVARLCDDAQSLLTHFRAIDDLFNTKIKDEKVLKMWSNFCKGLAIVTAVVGLLSVGVGLTAGFTYIVKKLVLISFVTAAPPAAAAIIVDAAQRLEAFEQATESLKKIKRQLSNLSKDFATIDGMEGELTMDDKEDFLHLLNHAQSEVDQGFELLAQL